MASERSWLWIVTAAVAIAVAASVVVRTFVKDHEKKTLTIYSGRGENLVGPLLRQANKALGIELRIRYGNTAQMALAILEEGKNTRADIFLAQETGALGALAREGRLLPLPRDLLEKLDSRFRSPEGVWVGLSARARVIDYNTRLVDSSELPKSIHDLTGPRWKGRVGWAPANGSFQTFVTAMRLLEGNEKAEEWLRAMKANGAQSYASNSPILEALGRGEVHLGLVNDYYLQRFTEKDPQFPVTHHFTKGDAGALVLVSGAALVDNAGPRRETAVELLNYLLSPEAQRYFAETTYEYPLLKGTPPPNGRVPLEELDPPEIDLSNLDDLEGTLEMLQREGLL